MSATPPETSVLEHEVRIAAPPETVFAYFTDPMRMVQWMGAESTLDPRPGGICRIVFQPSELAAQLLDAAFTGDRPDVRQRLREGGTRVMSGRFVEVEPPDRIAFTWGWEEELYTLPPQSTDVEVSFTPEGQATVVRLVHRRLPAPAVAIHRGGWEHYLPRLALAAAGGDPGPDPWQALLG